PTMPIRVTCPACRRTFRVADDYAGRRGRCAHCEEPVRVPDEDLPLLESLPEGEYDADDDWPGSRDREPAPRPTPRDHLPAGPRGRSVSLAPSAPLSCCRPCVPSAG